MAITVSNRLVLCIAILSLVVPAATIAGEVQLSWDASAGATGYRVYRGTSPNNYGAPTDVGNTTQASVDGLDDCTNWFFAVTALNAAGESNYSLEESSWPRAVLSSANPTVVEQGSTVSVVVSGMNFRDGDNIALSNAGLQLDSISLGSCQQLTLNLTVAANAPLGSTNVVVTHPSGVAGTGTAMFSIAPPTPLTVAATSPVDGATDVPLTVNPFVRFSEAVSGVNSTTVRLLTSGGSPVAQAAGSPSLSPDGTVATIVPASDLDFASTYRLQVIGGASGVESVSGHTMTSDFLQPNGFTTVGDQNGPDVTDVAATNVTGTSAEITWTTNEVADSEVSYRKQGNQLYQTVYEATDVTAHSLGLTGLSPDTTYEFHVRSVDASGNGTTTSDETFTTTASIYTYLGFEAEAGVLVDPIGAASGDDAFSGGWIETPGNLGQGTAGNPNGTATFGVNVPESGVWFLWVRVYAANASANSWFESMDGASRQSMTWNALGEWAWAEGSGYDLGAGLHTVELAGREGGARADRVLLTNDPDFVPTEAPDTDVTPPSAVADLVATGVPAEGAIDLSWTNPAAGDLASIVIRYRTDGQYPTSPVDGLALVDEPATPGAGDATTHGGIEPETTYHYSAFAVDESGNVSAAGHATGAIIGVPPPPQNVSVH